MTPPQSEKTMMPVNGKTTIRFRRRMHPSQPGFTLIELLVVIAIISLLVSILVPSLTKAKELARRSICGGNLHHINICLHYYANDFNGSYPPRFKRTLEDMGGDYNAVVNYGYISDLCDAKPWGKRMGSNYTLRGNGTGFERYVGDFNFQHRPEDLGVLYCPNIPVEDWPHPPASDKDYRIGQQDYSYILLPYQMFVGCIAPAPSTTRPLVGKVATRTEDPADALVLSDVVAMDETRSYSFAPGTRDAIGFSNHPAGSLANFDQNMRTAGGNVLRHDGAVTWTGLDEFTGVQQAGSTSNLYYLFPDTP
ncbi:MAG: type II secretion system protein [Phycisphaerae bacterium]|nr:type II secretion system protein [Phycisphaerae bacterium]